MFGQGRKPDQEAWLREAKRAYEAVFGERDRIQKCGRLMTFSEIEEEAVREGNQLARWLLEGKVAAESDRAGCQGATSPCPRCGQPAKRRREEPESRSLRSRPGSVGFSRYEYYCAPCRRPFFPSGHPAGSQG